MINRLFQRCNIDLGILKANQKYIPSSSGFHFPLDNMARKNEVSNWSKELFEVVNFFPPISSLIFCFAFPAISAFFFSDSSHFLSLSSNSSKRVSILLLRFNMESTTLLNFVRRLPFSIINLDRDFFTFLVFTVLFTSYTIFFCFFLLWVWHCIVSLRTHRLGYKILEPCSIIMWVCCRQFLLQRSALLSSLTLANRSVFAIRENLVLWSYFCRKSMIPK